MSKSASKLRAVFFAGEPLPDGRVPDMVEIKIVGDPNTVIRMVGPKDLDEWPSEWSAYQGGKSHIDVGGTLLTEVPGITRDTATALRLKGVRNVEELAALDDAACKSLGMQGLAWRRAASLILKEKELDELKADREARRGPGRPPKTPDQVAAA